MFPADDINCKIRFPTKEWKETMANHSSKSYVEFANETEGMVIVVIINLFVTENDSVARLFTDT